MTVPFRSVALVLSLAASLLITPLVGSAQQATPTALPPSDARVFDATGQWLAGGFRAYWEANGGLKQFGYPISPPLRDADGRTIQWLERARFEHHGDLPFGQRVLLGLLGSEAARGREATGAFARVPDPGDASWFEATGHTLRAGFRAYWQATGGLAVYGYPISEEFDEVNPADRRTYTVQYFQRNRMEFHPDLEPAYRISLGLLGRQRYAGGGDVVGPPPADIPVVPASATPPPSPRAPVAAGRVSAIGDSVMLGAAAALKQQVNGIEVDATVSRQFGEGLTVIRARRAAGSLAPLVVVQLGNNAPISANQFDQLMDSLADASRVVIVNLKVPRAWEAGNNAILSAGVARYPKAILADWKSIAGDRPDFFWDDGIHLRPAGAQAYATMVVRTLGG